MGQIREENSEAIDANLRKQSRGQACMEWVAIIVVFFVIGGAPAPHVNETQYLTKAKHYWNPEFCPSDAFLDSADAHLVFYWTVGWLTNLLSLTATAWVGRLAAWGLIAWGWLHLSRAAFDRTGLPTFSAAAFLTLLDCGNLAGEWVVGGVEGKCFAYAFVFRGLAEVVRRGWRTTWMWLGLGAAFHPLVGGWAVISCLLIWIVDGPRRVAIASMLPGLIVGGVISLAGLVPALLLNAHASVAEKAEAARIYVFERLPHHLALLSLPPDELQWKLTRFAMVACVGGLAAILLLRMAKQSTSQSASFHPLQRIAWFTGVSLLFLAVGLVIESTLGPTATAARVLRFYWYRQADVAVPMLAALTLALLADIVLRESRSQPVFPVRLPTWTTRLAPVLVVGSLLFVGWHLLSSSAARLKDPRPPATRRMANFADWQAACRWARENTPRDALFLVDRHAQSFKWYAHRGDVCNWKDIPQDAAGVLDWFDRYRKTLTRTDRSGETHNVSVLAHRRTKTCLALAKQYEATHLLTRSTPPLRLPIAYATVDYTLYEVPSSDFDPSSP